MIGRSPIPPPGFRHPDRRQDILKDADLDESRNVATGSQAGPVRGDTGSASPVRYVYTCPDGHTEESPHRRDRVVCGSCFKPMRRDHKAEGANVIPPK